MMHGSVRMARNVAEKQRRDRLNSFINDLANSVPLVASATRRLDKTSILRLSAAFLRLHDSPLNVITYRQTAKDIVDSAGIENTSHSSTPVPLPLSPVTSNCLAGDQLNSLMEGLDGFVIVVNNDFKLMYVGPTCERFLGHQNIDMLGHQLSNFLHPADVEPVRQAVLDLKNQFLSSGQLESERIQFRCRMKERAQPRTEVVTYQIVKISGFFQLACPDNNSSTGNNNNSSSSSSNGSSQLAESLDHEAADVATLNQDDDASHGEISSPSRLAFTPVTAAATVTATAATSASNGTDTVASSSSSSSIVILSNGSEFEINHSSYPSSVTQDSDLIELDFQLSDFSPDSRSSFYPDFINECPPSSDHHHHHHQDHHHRQRHTLPPPPPLIPSTQLSQPSRHLMPVNGNCDRSSISLNNNSNNNHFNFLTPILSTTSSHASSTLSSPSSKRRLKQQQHHQHHRTPQPSNKQSLSSRFSGKFLSKNLMFKGFVEIVPASPMSELSLMDANQEEYVSRISLDGTLLYADHRFVALSSI